MESSKNNLGVISAIGLLLLILGYIYVLYNLNDVNTEIKDKKSELLVLNDSLKISRNELVEVKHNKEIIHNIDQTSLKYMCDLIYTTEDSTLIKKAINEMTTNQNLLEGVESMNKGASVYVQVASKKVRSKLWDLKLSENLREKGFQTTGYNYSYGKADNTVRYFTKEDAEIASEIQTLLKNDFGIDLRTVLIEKYGEEVPKNQIELWIM